MDPQSVTLTLDPETMAATVGLAGLLLYLPAGVLTAALAHRQGLTTGNGERVGIIAAWPVVLALLTLWGIGLHGVVRPFALMGELAGWLGTPRKRTTLDRTGQILPLPLPVEAPRS